MIPLQIFEKHPGVEGASGPVYRVGGSFTPYAIVATEKRFTDAELAAEWWKQAGSVSTVEATGGTPTTTLAKLDALHRFATLPHFDA